MLDHDRAAAWPLALRLALALDAIFQPFGQQFRHRTDELFAKPHDIRRRNHRYRADRNDDGIGKFVEHGERDAEFCNDERKFANLAKTRTCIQGVVQTLARHKDANGAQNRVEEQLDAKKQQKRRPMLENRTRHHHHANRHEKDGAKQILYRRHEMLDALRLGRGPQNRTDRKRPKRRRKIRTLREHDHPKA